MALIPQRLSNRPGGDLCSSHPCSCHNRQQWASRCEVFLVSCGVQALLTLWLSYCNIFSLFVSLSHFNFLYFLLWQGMLWYADSLPLVFCPAQIPMTCCPCASHLGMRGLGHKKRIVTEWAWTGLFFLFLKVYPSPKLTHRVRPILSAEMIQPGLQRKTNILRCRWWSWVRREYQRANHDWWVTHW